MTSRVVVWLGAMRNPPLALNEIDGVHLPSRLVNGWPRFPHLRP